MPPKGMTGLKYKPMSLAGRQNISKAKMGHIPWNKGITGYLHTKFKVSVSYSGIHKWIVLRLGKAKKCESCGVENIKAADGRNAIHWANKSRKYKRELTDWIALCSTCHGKYDKGYRSSSTK